MQKFWKIQDICYQIGTEIFKVEEELFEIMKPKVANSPLKNGQNIGVFTAKNRSANLLGQ